MSSTSLSTEISGSIEAVVAFFKEPTNLAQWTVHRDLYMFDSSCWESTTINGQLVFTKIEVTHEWLRPAEEASVDFGWYRNAQCIKQFRFNLQRGDAEKTTLSVSLSAHLPDQIKHKIARLLTLEFQLLNAIFGHTPVSLSRSDAEFIQTYHLELST